jgi:hypothetical protein
MLDLVLQGLGVPAQPSEINGSLFFVTDALGAWLAVGLLGQYQASQVVQV